MATQVSRNDFVDHQTKVAEENAAAAAAEEAAAEEAAASEDAEPEAKGEDAAAEETKGEEAPAKDADPSHAQENNRRFRPDARTRRVIKSAEQRLMEKEKDRLAVAAERDHYKALIEKAKDTYEDTEKVFTEEAMTPPKQEETAPSRYQPTEAEFLGFEAAVASIDGGEINVAPDYVEKTKENFPEVIGAVSGLRNPGEALLVLSHLQEKEPQHYAALQNSSVTAIHEFFRRFETEAEVRRRMAEEGAKQAPARKKVAAAKKAAAKKVKDLPDEDEGDEPEPSKKAKGTPEDYMSDRERQIFELKKSRLGRYQGSNLRGASADR